MALAKREYATLFVLALAMRLGVLMFLYAQPTYFDPAYVTDHWDHLSRNVIAGNGFSWTTDGSVPTISRGPGFVGFLMLLTVITNESLLGMRVLYLLVDAVLVLVVARLGYEVTASRVAAVLAGVVYALYPIPAWHVVKLSPDAFFSLVLTSALLLFLLTMRPRLPNARYRDVFAAGLVLGVAILTKKTALLVGPVWLLTALCASRFGKTACMRAAVYVAAAALVVVPWLYRNYRVSGRVAPVQTMTWHVFWYGEFVDREGRGVESDDFEYRAVEFLAEVSGERPYRISHELTPVEDLEREARLKTLALAYIRENPTAFAGKIGRNLMRFWYRTESGRMTRYTAAMGVVLFVLSAFGAGCVIASHRFGMGALLLLVTVGLFHVAYTPVLAHIRYMIPVSPHIAVFSGYGLSRLWMWLHHPRPTEVADGWGAHPRATG